MELRLARFSWHLKRKPDLDRIEEVCETYHDLIEARKAGGTSLVSFVLSRHASIRQMVVFLRALPRIDVTLRASGAGWEIANHLSVRHGGRYVNRWAVGVLSLPDQPDEYLRGRKRQAVRTNLHRAEELGLAFRELSDPATKRAELASILSARREEFWDVAELVRGVDRASSRVFVAEDRTGAIQALATVVVDVQWAHMYLCVSLPGDAAFAALYLLNVGVVQQLAAERVRHLFVRSALHLSPGQRYLQARLGFELMNLRMTRRFFRGR
jgi:hypothetical protein